MKITTPLAGACQASLLSALFAGCGGSETKTDIAAVALTQPATGWSLIWSDEFNTTSIDEKKWNFEINCSGGGNNEKQCYTADKDNAFISDGMLNIVAKPAAAGAAQPYTSARLTTKKKADFKYGRFEMRAKLPACWSGQLASILDDANRFCVRRLAAVNGFTNSAEFI